MLGATVKLVWRASNSDISPYKSIFNPSTLINLTASLVSASSKTSGNFCLIVMYYDLNCSAVGLFEEELVKYV